MTSPVETMPSGTAGGDTDSLHRRRFRFKRKHRDRDYLDRNRESPSNDKLHSRQSHHRRHKKPRTSPPFVDDPSTYDDSASRLPPDSAFRESLFDAMGDDEGAAFWEGVYGQPIHSYSNAYCNNETGELEEMNDEEYAQFVRRKMWERSQEGVEAAREEKRRERMQEKENARNEEKARNHRNIPKQEADFLFDLDIENSLRRGERRRDKKRWQALWEGYEQRWAELQSLRESMSMTDENNPIFLRNKIAWPVETGKRKDVNAEEIERFIKHCAEIIDDHENPLQKIVKSERVRWHPDKIQQRYGSMGIDEGTMHGVTAVFQVIDRIWNEMRTSG